jgi:hypothetical protein
MGLAQSSFIKRKKNKRARAGDAPNAFTLSSKRRKKDGRKGAEEGKSKSQSRSSTGKKHKRRKR